MSWYDPQEEGDGFGEASINDDFDKTVPVKIISNKLEYRAKELSTFTLSIPITDLGNQKPNDLYLELYANVNRAPSKESYNKAVEISFSMTWPSS